MEKDLNLDGDKYDWLLTIFYISYILFQFQAFMWKIMWVDAPERRRPFVVTHDFLASLINGPALLLWHGEL